MKETSGETNLSEVYYIDVAQYSGAYSFIAMWMVSWENMTSGN
jgi:hypothetical protein